MNKELSPMEGVYQLGFQAGWKAKSDEIVSGIPIPESSVHDNRNIIITAVCEYFNTHLKNLQLRTRKRTIAVPRQICMYLLVKKTSMTKSDVGRLFSMDHSSVIHSEQLIRNLMDTQHEETVQAMAMIEKRLQLTSPLPNINAK